MKENTDTVLRRSSRIECLACFMGIFCEPFVSLLYQLYKDTFRRLWNFREEDVFDSGFSIQVLSEL